MNEERDAKLKKYAAIASIVACIVAILTYLHSIGLPEPDFNDKDISSTNQMAQPNKLKPKIKHSCNDDVWEAKNFWLQVGEKQYAAELLAERENGYKFKIVQRVSSEIRPLFCRYFQEPPTTNTINQMYSIEPGAFHAQQFHDAGDIETIKFWIYK